MNRDQNDPRTPAASWSLLLGLVLLLGLLASSAALAQTGDGAASPADTFTEETSVTVVEVPVQVLDDGVPVRGLTADDFVVTDGEETRPILSFEVIDLAETAGPVAAAEAPAAARRHFLLLFDLSFTELDGLVRAEQGARELITRGLHPQDLVAVAFYSDRKGLTLPLAFTSDRGQALRVLDGLAALLSGEKVETRAEVGGGGAAAAADPLRLTLGAWEATLSDLGGTAGIGSNPAQEALAAGAGAGGNPRRASGGPQETLAGMDEQATLSVRQLRRSQVRNMANILQELVQQMKNVEGAKHLVMFSGGFPSYVYGANTIRMDPGVSQTLQVLTDTVEAFRRAGWMIQAVEPRTDRSLIAGEGDGTGGLFFLSEETGGGLYTNLNQVSDAMDRMLQRTSVTYVLSFQSPPIATDGSFRPIEVQLKERRRGVDVVHRTGYYAPEPFLAKDPESRRWETAQAVLAGRGRDELGMAVMAAPFRFTEGLEYVPVVVEVDGAKLLAGHRAGADAPLGLEIYAYALSDDGYGDGEIRDFFVRTLNLDPAQARPALESGSGLKFYGDLALPPGRYNLRLLIRALPSGLESVQGLRLEIPDLSGRNTVLLPPVFIQGQDEQWLMVREGDGVGKPYPFVFQGQEFVPAALSRLDDDTQGRLLLMGYNLGDGELDFEVRLLDEEGRQVDAGRLAFVARAEGDGSVPDAVAITLDPVGLAPGDYQLAFDLVDGETGETSTTTTRFRVEGSGAAPAPQGGAAER